MLVFEAMGWAGRTTSSQPEYQAMRVMRTEILTLRETLKALLESAPDSMAMCSGFHHAKKDRHEAGEACPCEFRYAAAIEAAKTLLARS